MTVELGKELVGIDQDEGGVTATILTHSNGSKDKLRVDYLVGTDGAKGMFNSISHMMF